MRDNRWWLQGRKLRQRSASTRLIPRGDVANAPPFLPLAPTVDSGAVHNMGGYSIDDGNDEWFTGRDDYLNENAAAPPPADLPPADAWEWGSEFVDDFTMEVEATAQTSHLDPGDLPEEMPDLFVAEDAYEDPTTDLTEASVGPVQPNAPALDSPPQEVEWDFFEDQTAAHVVPTGHMQSDADDSQVLAFEWPWDDDAGDDLHLIVDDDDDALPPDTVVATDGPPAAADQLDEIEADDWWHALDATPEASELGPDDAWPWAHQDDVDEPPLHIDEPAGITLPVLEATGPDFTEDDATEDLWWIDETPQRADAPPDDAWPWAVEDLDEAPLHEDPPQRADPPPADAWEWDDSGEDPQTLDEPPQSAAIAANMPAEDAWPWWDSELLPDVVPTGYMQADTADLSRQEGDDVLHDWAEWDGAQVLIPTGYLQADLPPPPPEPNDARWHWEGDHVEDEWSDFIENIGASNVRGADASVAGNANAQNLLRRRDDFTSDPSRDLDWVWEPTADDDAQAIESTAAFFNSNFSPLPGLLQTDAWDFDAENVEPEPIEIEPPVPNRAIDADVLGNPALQNLLRRRDDFFVDPPRDEDWDWYQLDPQEELPLDSGPVGQAQVLFLEVPVEDGADHFPPDPDNDWQEPSEPVGAPAPADLPRVSEEHDWKHWEDGEGDYEIEPSAPVDAPNAPAPDEHDWNEEASEDGWWHGNTPEVTPADAPPALPGPALAEAWDFDGESTDADAWWANLTTRDTDGAPGIDTCPMELAAALARIAELEAELAECRRHHGDGGGGGASGDGDDIHHGHNHGHHGGHHAAAEQREIIERHARERRERIARNNALIMAIVGAVVHGMKGPPK